MAPYLSVIVPTKNDSKYIDGCLQSLFQQTFKEYEVIVVDGHSDDDTVEKARKYPAQIFFENIGSRGGACNVGAENAQGEVLVFTDADCILPSDWLEKIAKCFRSTPELGALGGLDLNAKDDTLIAKSKGVIMIFRRTRAKEDMAAAYKIKGCNSAYRKNLFRMVGGFDSSLKYSEDSELHGRLLHRGARLLFDPDIYVWHFRRQNNLLALKRSIKNARNSVPAHFRRQTLLSLRIRGRYGFTSHLIFFGSLIFILALMAATLNGLFWLAIQIELLIIIIGILCYTAWTFKNYFSFPESLLVPLIIVLDTVFRLIGIYQGLILQLIHRKERNAH